MVSADDFVGRDLRYLSAPISLQTPGVELESRWINIVAFWRSCMESGRSRGLLLACDPGTRGWVADHLRKAGGKRTDVDGRNGARSEESEDEDDDKVTGMERVGPLVCAMIGVWAMERDLRWSSWLDLSQVLASRAGVGKDWADEIKAWQNKRRDWGNVVNRMRDK